MNDTSSINKEEIQKFSKASGQWWNLDGEFKMLHQINPIRLEYIINKINQHFKGSLLPDFSIIDIGCGGGLIAAPLAKIYPNISGLDASPENISAAINHAQQHNLPVNYINSTAEVMVAGGALYDVVLCLEVVEHVANAKEFIQTLTKLVKPGGMLILSTINRTPKSYLQAIIMAEYILGWVPKKTHDHAKFLKPSELNSSLAGLMELKELKGLTYDLPSGRWCLTDNIDVNYFAYMVKG